METSCRLDFVSAQSSLSIRRLLTCFISASSRADVEPTITYQGHSAPITSLCVSTRHSIIFSASLDGTVRLFRLPGPDRSTYDPADTSLLLETIEPNSDAIWGVKVFGPEDESLALVAADGTIQVWNWQEKELIRKWRWEWTEEEKNDSFGKSGRKKLPRSPVPTALEVVHLDGKVLLAVAFQNAVVKLYDPASGDYIKRLAADETNGAFSSSFTLHPDLVANSSNLSLRRYERDSD